MEPPISTLFADIVLDDLEKIFSYTLNSKYNIKPLFYMTRLFAYIKMTQR